MGNPTQWRGAPHAAALACEACNGAHPACVPFSMAFAAGRACVATHAYCPESCESACAASASEAGSTSARRGWSRRVGRLACCAPSGGHSCCGVAMNSANRAVPCLSTRSVYQREAKERGAERSERWVLAWRARNSGRILVWASRHTMCLETKTTTILDETQSHHDETGTRRR